MAINLTWPNIFVLVGLLATLLAGLVAGTGAAIQWRIDAVQTQLADRLVAYQREMDRIEKRLDRLEGRP